MMDDRQLLNRIAADDQFAFKRIYDRYAMDMLLYGMNVLRRREVVEDMVQNIFIDLWSKRTSLEITNLKPYLFRAVKYQIFNHFRDNKLSQEDITRLNIIDLSMNVSRELEYSELEELVTKCVSQLPNRCQQIFLLSRFQHKTNKEIAHDLDISIQAVKNQISKAIGIIRLRLKEEELIYGLLILLFSL